MWDFRVCSGTALGAQIQLSETYVLFVTAGHIRNLLATFFPRNISTDVKVPTLLNNQIDTYACEKLCKSWKNRPYTSIDPPDRETVSWVSPIWKRGRQPLMLHRLGRIWGPNLCSWEAFQEAHWTAAAAVAATPYSTNGATPWQVWGQLAVQSSVLVLQLSESAEVRTGQRSPSASERNFRIRIARLCATVICLETHSRHAYDLFRKIGLAIASKVSSKRHERCQLAALNQLHRSTAPRCDDKRGDSFLSVQKSNGTEKVEQVYTSATFLYKYSNHLIQMHRHSFSQTYG